MINDRITDGETEATLKNILTTEELPGLYTQVKLLIGIQR